jgi:hypothetical protein
MWKGNQRLIFLATLERQTPVQTITLKLQHKVCLVSLWEIFEINAMDKRPVTSIIKNSYKSVRRQPKNQMDKGFE